MPINQEGEINTTALIVPDIYVQIVPPTVSLMNGVPTNVLGVVGTAAWGPEETPVTISSMADYVEAFGPIQSSSADGAAFDLGVGVATAVQQGANNLRCVRRVSGASAKATVTWAHATDGNFVTFTSKWGGTHGNNITITIADGTNNQSSARSHRVSVSLAGKTTETFDNIAHGATIAATVTNVVNAITLGQSGVRGPSAIVTAAAASSASTTQPASATATLTCANGTNGTAISATSTLVGALNGTTSTGLYALAGQGVSVGFLAGCAATGPELTSMIAFGKAHGVYMVAALAADRTIADAITDMAGKDSYVLKVLHGDHVLWYDGVNTQTRTVSPAGFVAGRMANLSPEQSSLNKPVYGVIATSRIAANRPYSDAELQSLGQNRLDVLTTPSPAGWFYSTRFGHNCSSNPVINTDGYTRMTNYIASTLESGMGIFIGQLQTPTVRRSAKSTLESCLSAVEGQGMIGSADGRVPFQVILDDSNNPQSRVALGYMQADVKVRYLSVVEKLVVNVEGGQSVEIQRVDTAAAV
ncbi:MAG: phage tail protein [Gammaproteobacteria bacterium]|nr:phage tail protein [Gammaproteobacteria bacterium]